MALGSIRLAAKLHLNMKSAQKTGMEAREEVVSAKVLKTKDVSHRQSGGGGVRRPLSSKFCKGVIGDVVGLIEAGVSARCADWPPLENEMGVLKTGSVSTGYFLPEQIKAVEPSDVYRLRTQVKKGTIIFCRKNSDEAVGASAVCDRDMPRVFLSDLLWRISPKKGIDLYWLSELVASAEVRAEVRARSTGTQATMKNISKRKFLNIGILIPSPSEQKFIGHCLRLFRIAESSRERCVYYSGSALSYLRETLLHGTHRFPNFTDPWPMLSLGQVTRQQTARNQGRHGRDRVMGVTKAEGLVPMREHVIAEEIGRYLRLPPGGFAYNPMRINIGSITMSELDEDVIVSPDYVAFECDRTRLDPRFLNHLRRTQAWADYMTIAGNGSVRVRIYYADLAGFEFHLPSLAEQARIVEVLDDAEREIALLREEKALREKQRNALATALLTGRLPIPESMLEAERMAAAMAEQGSIVP